MYSTVHHLKYGLINGENGIFKCSSQKLRLISYENSELLAIDTSGSLQKIKIEPREFLLKQALLDKNYEKSKTYMKELDDLCKANSIVGYLYKKNYSGFAMNLVDDKKAKFSLAIDNGNLEVAFKICGELKDKELFKKLGEEALR